MFPLRLRPTAFQVPCGYPNQGVSWIDHMVDPWPCVSDSKRRCRCVIPFVRRRARGFTAASAKDTYVGLSLIALGVLVGRQAHSFAEVWLVRYLIFSARSISGSPPANQTCNIARVSPQASEVWVDTNSHFGFVISHIYCIKFNSLYILYIYYTYS